MKPLGLSLHHIIFLSALAGVCFVLAAHAEEVRLTFTIPTTVEPSTAVGILMHTDGVEQKPGAEVTKESPTVLRVSFVVNKNEIKPGTFASAVVYSSEGDVASSEVRAMDSPETIALAPCPPEPVTIQNVSNQIGLLQSLVSVRVARRENAQARLKELFTPELLETLAKLERGFGVQFPEPLSADLHPLELIDRLTRIQHAVKNYRAGKPQAQADSRSGS